MTLRRSIVFIGLLTIAVAVVPHAAHAASSPVEFLTDPGLYITVMIRDVLQFVAGVLTDFIVWIGDRLQEILNLPLSTGGVAVYAVWKMLRDMCNMLFIVAFIVMSFATIFGVFLKGDYYYSNAIKGVLIAAITINFSLAVGQTIIWGGNEATKMVLDLLPENTGASIALKLRVLDVIGGAQEGNAISSPNQNTARGRLTPAQRIVYDAWSKDGNTDAKKVLEDCLAHNGTPAQCMEQATQSTSFAEDVLSAAGAAYSTTGEALTAGVEALAGQVVPGGATILRSLTGRETKGDKDWKTQLEIIESIIIQILFLLVLSLSFLAVLVFMIIRIPAMWLLLSVSPLAFFSLAIPGQSRFKDWFNGVLAWSIFSPLYLFIVYIGLYLVERQGALLESLRDPGGNIPFIAGNLASLLFLIIAGAIFIGGAGWAMKYSFSLGKGIGNLAVGTWWGATAGRWFGMSEKEPVLFRLAGSLTGITPRLQARKEQIAQKYGDIVAGARGRFPSLLRTEEEALALRREQRGVRGADKKYADAIAKRVDTQKAIIESNRLKTEDLKKLLKSGNRDAKLAAGEILLGKGELTAEEREVVLKQYGEISGLAKKNFQTKVTAQLQKESARTWAKYTDTGKEGGAFDFEKFIATAQQAGGSEDKRKFLEAAMRGEVGSRARFDASQLQKLADTLDNNEDKRLLFETVSRSGRNKVVAIETMAALGLITDRAGKRLDAAGAIADRIDSLSSPDDLLDAEDYYQRSGNPMPTPIQEKFNASLFRDRSKSAKMLRNANPEQVDRLYGSLVQEAERVRSAQEGIESQKTSERRIKKIEDRWRRRMKGIKSQPARRSIERKIEKLGDIREKLKRSYERARKTL
ncbi:MAG: hypothetical protein IT406_02260 [Candidatus Yanofskybacteria bacterium]|nr:hypothetical protein [Candidatus Yanofskybacteria bacterium]